MNIAKLSDQELWVQVTVDNSEAFVVLYNRYWKRLLRTAHLYLKDLSSAEEIVHDVFVVLWDRRKFLKINNFQGYILVTAKYHIFKKIKAEKSSPIEFVEILTENDMGTDNVQTTPKQLQEDFEKEILHYLRGLPKRCKEIFYLSRVKDLSNSEIAEAFGITRFTVENQITHALKHIRALINIKTP
jgi:RNA polymerase sigma-70 factor (family 1)